MSTQKPTVHWLVWVHLVSLMVDLDPRRRGRRWHRESKQWDQLSRTCERRLRFAVHDRLLSRSWLRLALWPCPAPNRVYKPLLCRGRSWPEQRVLKSSTCSRG